VGPSRRAREQLTAAVEVLRADPDTDTVRALDSWRRWRCSPARPTPTGSRPRRSPSARPSTSAPASSASLFSPAGSTSPPPSGGPGGRLLPRERAARHPGRRQLHLGRALLNLADALAHRPRRRRGAARTAAGHLRRAGARDFLAVAIMNLAQALLMLGDWDAAEAELTQAVDSDGLADIEFLTCYGAGWRRCAATPPPPRPCWRDCGPARQRGSPGQGDDQPRREAFTAAARRQPPTRCATPARCSPTRTPSGSATSACAGRGRWPPAPPSSWGHRRRPRAARPARLLPARAPGPDAAGRTRPGPRPPGRRRRRPGRRGRLRRRDHQPARAEHPLPPGPRPARPRRVPHPPRRRRRGAGHRRSPRHRRRLRCQPLLDRADAAADRRCGRDAAAAGGCFVSGGSAGNLSALVVAREVAKRKAGSGGRGPPLAGGGQRGRALLHRQRAADLRDGPAARARPGSPADRRRPAGRDRRGRPPRVDRRGRGHLGHDQRRHHR
jgi:hypothetical protein